MTRTKMTPSAPSALCPSRLLWVAALLLALAVPADAAVFCTDATVEMVKQWAPSTQRYVSAQVLLPSGTQKVLVFCDMGDQSAAVTESDCSAILSTLTVAAVSGSPITVTFADTVPVDVNAAPQVPAATCEEIDEWVNLEDWLKVVNLVAFN